MHPARAVFLLFALVVSISCEVDDAVYAAPPPDQIHQDLASLVQAAPLIIVGKVVDIQLGRIAGEGEAQLQFNDVHVGVERLLKGEPPDPLIVEQVAVAGQVLTPAVGPPYKRGERYVLFLRKGEGRRHITITQGRYLLQGGTVHPTEPGLAADKMKGMDEAKLIEEIAAIVQGQR